MHAGDRLIKTGVWQPPHKNAILPNRTRMQPAAALAIAALARCGAGLPREQVFIEPPVMPGS